METIKSFTDLQQSKKLVGILPLESADMLWGYYYNGKNHCIPNIRPFRDGRNEIPKCYIPAWSLAALLSVLPEIQGGKPIIDLDDNYITYPHMSDLHTKSDNLVDACVDMIEKLHESNLLL